MQNYLHIKNIIYIKHSPTIEAVILHIVLVLQNSVVLQNQHLLVSEKNCSTGFCLFQAENSLIFITKQM